MLNELMEMLNELVDDVKFKPTHAGVAVYVKAYDENGEERDLEHKELFDGMWAWLDAHNDKYMTMGDNNFWRLLDGKTVVLAWETPKNKCWF